MPVAVYSYGEHGFVIAGKSSPDKIDSKVLIIVKYYGR